MVKDKIFLLSNSEVKKYLPTEKSRRCKFNDTFNDTYDWWWLRSPGYNSNNAANVYSNGFLSCFGSDIDISISMVRPALHLNPTHLSSLKRTDTMCVKFANIEWLILNEDTGLLLSKEAVARHRFDADCNDYERSEIRAYLSGELLNEMFTEEEQKLIVDTVIDSEESHPSN